MKQAPVIPGIARVAVLGEGEIAKCVMSGSTREDGRKRFVNFLRKLAQFVEPIRHLHGPMDAFVAINVVKFRKSAELFNTETGEVVTQNLSVLTMVGIVNRVGELDAACFGQDDILLIENANPVEISYHKVEKLAVGQAVDFTAWATSCFSNKRGSTGFDDVGAEEPHIADAVGSDGRVGNINGALVEKRGVVDGNAGDA